MKTLKFFHRRKNTAVIVYVDPNDIRSHWDKTHDIGDVTAYFYTFTSKHYPSYYKFTEGIKPIME